MKRGGTGVSVCAFIPPKNVNLKLNPKLGVSVARPYPEVPIGKGTTKSAAGWGRAARAGGEGDPEGKIAPGDAPGEGKRRIPKPNEKGGREVETRKVGRAGLQVDPEFSHVTPSLLSAKQDELLSNVACFASTLLCSQPAPLHRGFQQPWHCA